MSLYASRHLLVDDTHDVDTIASTVGVALGLSLKVATITPDTLPAHLFTTYANHPLPQPSSRQLVTASSSVSHPQASPAAKSAFVLPHVLILLSIHEASFALQRALVSLIHDKKLRVATDHHHPHYRDFTLPEPFLLVGVVRFPGLLLPRLLDECLVWVRGGEREREKARRLPDLGVLRQDDSETVSKIRSVHVSLGITQYIRDIVNHLLVSPLARGGPPLGTVRALEVASRIEAFCRRSICVTPTHVKSVAPLVLSHRIQTVLTQPPTAAQQDDGITTSTDKKPSRLFLPRQRRGSHIAAARERESEQEDFDGDGHGAAEVVTHVDVAKMARVEGGEGSGSWVVDPSEAVLWTLKCVAPPC
ncbi:unnamed protein product [Vitrella brassicaformis CCMP3155]|uniref:magnesium chelatase n=2 Tax=Vitrella brassicaformis TaxID=1169539 RepID=A0A0G4EUC6_VITBC|nr:unnamed protein product [Vitrella brassicaformis CCMP3155]|eukprot:CEM01893.1 unnamed protein product [Vitrella brassicaformis CCMP3155]